LGGTSLPVLFFPRGLKKEKNNAKKEEKGRNRYNTTGSKGEEIIRRRKKRELLGRAPVTRGPRTTLRANRGL